MSLANSRGFSLLEIMLVLVLLGGVAALTIGTLPGDRRLHEAEARLATQLGWAAERAEQEGRIYGLALARQEWQWLRLVGSADAAASAHWPGHAWHAADDRTPSQNNRLPEQGQLQLLLAGKEYPLEARLSDPPPEPQILLLPGGERSPFELRLLADDLPPRTLNLEPLR